MTEALYVLAWQIYAVSALVAILMLWMATRWAWWLPAWLIRANFVVALALPTRVASFDGIYAPAWVSIIIDKVFTGMPSSALAQQSLVSVIELTTFMVCLAGVVFYLWKHRKLKFGRRSAASRVSAKVAPRYAQYARARSNAARRTRGLIHSTRLNQN